MADQTLWGLGLAPGQGTDRETTICPFEAETAFAVTFTPVTTTGLRLEVTMQPQWSAGLQEWKVK